LLFNPTTAALIQYFMPAIQTAAYSLAVQMIAVPVHAKDEIEGVIAARTRSGWQPHRDAGRIQRAKS